MTWTYNVIDRMVDYNAKLPENSATHLRDNGDVIIFRLVLYSHEDVSFNIFFSECVGRHKTVSLVNVVQENPTRNTV